MPGGSEVDIQSHCWHENWWLLIARSVYWVHGEPAYCASFINYQFLPDIYSSEVVNTDTYYSNPWWRGQEEVVVYGSLLETTNLYLSSLVGDKTLNPKP